MTEDLTSLTSSTTYTYTAYSDSTCTTAIASETFKPSQSAPGISVLPLLRTTVVEGTSRTYTVKLQSTPTGDVTVTVAKESGGDASLTLDTDPNTTGDQNTLTFTSSNWFTEQTVTLTAAADNDEVSSTVDVDHTASGGGYDGAQTKTLKVRIADTGEVGFVFSASSVSVPESGSGCSAANPTYTVKLLSQPEATCDETTMTVYTRTTCTTCDADLTVDTDLDTTGDQNTLTFSRTNWNTAQPICLHAANDEDALDGTTEFTHWTHQNCLKNYDGVYDKITATEADDDRVVVLSSGTRRGIGEGSSDTYSARLGGTPSATVTVTVTRTSGGDASLTVDTDPDTTGDQDTFTFTTTDWSTGQEFTLSAQEDADAEDGTADFDFTPSGGGYGSGDKTTVTVSETDNDMIRPILSAATLSGDKLSGYELFLSEGGTAEVSVELEAQPEANVTVNITEFSFCDYFDNDITVDTDPNTLGNQNTLTFTMANWSTPQTAVIAVAEDNDLLSCQETFTFQAESGNTFFESTTLKVTERENDILVLTEANTDTPVTAVTVVKGATATYRVELAPPAPTGAVTVTLTSDDTATATVDTDPDTTGNQNTLTFTTTNYNQPQTVTVTGVETGVAAIAHSVNGGGHSNVPEASIAVTVEIRLTASSITQTTAKLTIQGHTDQGQTKAWWYKRTTPTGDDTCHEVVAGTDTADLTGLTASTDYTYTAYSATRCADADKIVSGTFRTANPPTGGGGGGSRAEPALLHNRFERPVNGAVVSGIGLIAGWSFAEAAEVEIEAVTLYIDRRQYAVIPCCAIRPDVAAHPPHAAFPQANTRHSGWGMIQNWGNLAAGPHTIQVVVTSSDGGKWRSPRQRITVLTPGAIAFADWGSVAEAEVWLDGEELVLDGIVLRDKTTQAEHELTLRYAWQTLAQGFQVVASRPLTTARGQPAGLPALLAWVGQWAASWLWPARVTASTGIRAVYEVPADQAAVAGIGLIGGWAFPLDPTDAIATVTVELGDDRQESAPCCATRPDVARAYPDDARAALSGWGLVFNYGHLEEGEHDLTARIVTEAGVAYAETHTVRVARLGGSVYVDRFDLSGAEVELEGEEIVLSGVEVRDSASQAWATIDVRLHWSAATQGLAIVDSETVP